LFLPNCAALPLKAKRKRITAVAAADKIPFDAAVYISEMFPMSLTSAYDDGLYAAAAARAAVSRPE
jgi:hypothetical protein